MRTPALLAALLAVACAPAPVTPTPIPDQKAPDFPAGTGQEANYIAEASYPGPYGYGVGSVIPNYVLEGFPNAASDTSTLQRISLQDFYNPTGTGVFPPGSPYGEGTPLPKAIILDRAAVWCGPCNDEANTEIPPLFAQYHPMGGMWLLALDEGSVPGTQPTQAQLKSWLTRYGVNKNAVYPGSIDPQAEFSDIFEDAYPGNAIIRTKDMKIIKVEVGVPQCTLPNDPSCFYSVFENVLNDKPVLPGDPGM